MKNENTLIGITVEAIDIASNDIDYVVGIFTDDNKLWRTMKLMPSIAIKYEKEAYFMDASYNLYDKNINVIGNFN